MTSNHFVIILYVCASSLQLSSIRALSASGTCLIFLPWPPFLRERRWFEMVEDGRPGRHEIPDDDDVYYYIRGLIQS